MNTKQIIDDTSEARIIGINIKCLMQSRNISETRLARELKVSVMTIRRVISGETSDPRISTLSLIADFFNVSVDSLLERRDTPVMNIRDNQPMFIPILSWEDLKNFYNQNSNFDSESWERWHPIINTPHLKLNHNAFAIESKPSMQPYFPKGTLIIINPFDEPLDNDIVLIKTNASCEYSLRELVIDAPKWILQPIIEGSELLFYNKEEHDIIGVIVLTILHTRKN